MNYEYLNAMGIDVYVLKGASCDVDFNILCDEPSKGESELLAKILQAIGSSLEACTLNANNEATQLIFGQHLHTANCVNLPSLKEMADNPQSKRQAWQVLKSELSI